jgi:hypothetical protein
MTDYTPEHQHAAPEGPSGGQPQPSSGMYTQRYDVYGQPIAPPAVVSPYAPAVPRTSGKAITALVLGITSIFLCGPFLGVPAMVVSSKAKREIRASRGWVVGQGMASGGFWTGLVGTVFPVLVVLLVFGLGGFVQSSTFSSTCEPVTGSAQPC